MGTEALAYIGVCAVVICTPGPDTALTIRNSILGGRRSGILTAAGIASGQLTWTIAASVGIAGLIQASQPAFATLKIIGAAYLIFLGVQSIMAAVRGRPSHDERKAQSPELAPMLALRQGFLSNIANPKMAIFFLSLLPQFVPELRQSIASTPAIASLTGASRTSARARLRLMETAERLPIM